ncbi:hypothetical protein GGI12_005726 [Dipsacomyces acuminosporus]|nr:hypothetical protein GGI12_005726 [Dipsacomyces acuminosporus]
MITAVLTIFANTLALVLFCQSAINGITLSARRHALTPPTPPETIIKYVHEHKSSSMEESESTTRTETQIAIDKAVLPSQSQEKADAGACSLPKGCGSGVRGECGTACYRLSTGRVYNLIVPYLSIWLLAAQSLLGIGVTLSMLIWHLFELDRCSTLMRLTLVGFHIGFSLLMLASAVQTHITNDMCIKIFFIMLVGISVNFAMLGLVLGHNTAVWYKDAGLGICLFDIKQPAGWLRNLPMYSAAGQFLLCFFSTISIINAAFRLCLHTRFLSPRELGFVLFVYRGLGLLFANGLTGTLLSIAVIVLSSFGHFHYSPYWTLQWAVMSRIVSAALWHRANTDPWAPKHVFWSSNAYVLHPADCPVNNSTLCGNEHQGMLSSSNSTNAANSYHSPLGKPSNLGTLLSLAFMCPPRNALSLRAPAVQDAALSSIPGASDGQYPVSRHNTVVADSHCSSCNCASEA